MTRLARRGIAALIACAGLAACASTAPNSKDPPRFEPVYQGIATRLLDGDLASFLVQMSGARDRADVAAYAECAAAQYALIRGYGFARHLRTNIVEEGGVWRGDAVYTISSALPRGERTIDAEVTVANCAEQGIPTV